MNFTDIVNPGVKQLKPYVPGRAAETIEREYGITEIVKLASNENPHGCSAKVSSAITDNLTELGRYPDASGHALKAALSEFYNIAQEQITLGNGSNDVIEILIRTFVNHDCNVVVSQFAFAIYHLISSACGATVKTVPAVDYGHDLDGMLQAIDTNTRLVCIANPNNPTGTRLDADKLQHFIAQVPANVLILLDEAYTEYQTDDYPSFLPLLAQYPNLIISRTFSKAYGLAGLRCGFSLSSVEIADLLNRIRQSFNVNSLALVAAEVALADQQFIKQCAKDNHVQKELMYAECTKRNLNYIPSNGNFVCIELPNQKKCIDAFHDLLPYGVIARPLAGYGMPNHLRITIGLGAENQKFWAALDKVLQIQ